MLYIAARMFIAVGRDLYMFSLFALHAAVSAEEAGCTLGAWFEE